MIETQLTPTQRRTMLARRAWTPQEREVVLQGFWGRIGIAIEPVLGSIVFLGLTVGMWLRAGAVPATATGSLCVAGIFALGFFAFVAYGIGVMATPLRALLSTSEPIFVVDGYIRTRLRDADSEYGSPGYIAVLMEDKTVVYEWPARGDGKSWSAVVRPAHIEFSEYGGVHKIDGQSTGVLPERMAALGIGINARR